MISDLVRPWTYQTCNEFGWFQTSNSREQHFGTKYPLEFFTTICKDVFGASFTSDSIHSQIMSTNRKFLGKTLEIDNIYMTHGELDPWRLVGKDEQHQMVTLIPSKFSYMKTVLDKEMHICILCTHIEYAHCKDLNSISEHDTKEMRASKERIASLIDKWLML